MNEQMDLFAARAARDEALERVEEHADDEWKAEAEKAVLRAASELRLFTSDDVMVRLSDDVSTHELRALGPIMLAAARRGWIAKADCAPVLCKRASRHAAPLTVWRSLLFRGVS